MAMTPAEAKTQAQAQAKQAALDMQKELAAKPPLPASYTTPKPAPKPVIQPAPKPVPKPGTDKLPQASLTPAQQNAMASQLGLSPSNPNMGMPKSNPNTTLPVGVEKPGMAAMTPRSNPNSTQTPMPMGKPGTASPTLPGMKRGGAVRSKPQTKFASGGSVGSASRRGDGIAQRGKTKGRMC